jgi:hypothetical protein
MVQAKTQSISRRRSDVEGMYELTVRHLQTVQVAVDRLHELGATDKLKLLSGRLQHLTLLTREKEHS